ncbi:MAG: hypothetical protein ACAI43_02510 [Phycisphaerae bacterium]|nr:hypothetical protein [Tepidisphaeraceae bacterium]
MKSATKHAEELKSLMKRLHKEHKPEPREKQEPLRALVRGALSFDVTDERAAEAMKSIEREFVDLNELRVATELELVDLLGPKYPFVERRVTMVTQGLTMIFEREHTLSLDRLATISKKDVRQFLRDMPDIHPFAEAYVMLMAFEAGCVPLDDVMTTYLVEHGVLEPGTGLEEGQRWLENHLKAEEVYDFFVMTRDAALDAADAAEKKAGGAGAKKKAKA